MSDDDRARQARIHAMMLSGESVPDVGGVGLSGALERANSNASGSKSKSNSKSTSSKSNSPNQSHHTSPSHSRSASRKRASGEKLKFGTATDPTSGIGLTFQKQDVIASPVPSSHLAQQLQLARTLDHDSNFPRSASMAPQRFTVYLPHEEGSMVQIEVPATCSAHQLVKTALACAKEEAGGELPSGLLDDPWAYRVYVAEEDGEIDTDYPALDVRMNVCTLGVEAFVLRDRVDAAQPVAARVGQNGRPAAGSIIEGPGVDHSKNDSKNTKGFASLETDTDERKNGESGQQVCCTKCTIQ